MMARRSRRWAAVLAMVLVASGSGVADARRGGSFGSRGSRTFSAPRATRLAPGYVPGISRTMTPRGDYGSQRYAPSYATRGPTLRRPGMGFGGGLLAGVVTGGLIGALLGHHGGVGGGYGEGSAGGGLLALLIQLALIGGIVWFALRLFRGAARPGVRSDATAYAVAAAPANGGSTPFGGFGMASPPAVGGGDDSIAIDAQDQRAFEDLLVELQDAFGREDYGRLRAITTPEMVSYLAEELGENAARGRRNTVAGTVLLDGEVSEAWREGDADYATIAMRYQSVDVVQDRASGAVIDGDPTHATQTTELWTFVRGHGPWSAWKVSAIQDA